MKLENLEKALRDHLDTVEGRRAARSGNAENRDRPQEQSQPPLPAELTVGQARAAAYEEMTPGAWQDYLSRSLDQLRHELLNELRGTALPADAKEELARRLEAMRLS